MAIYNEILAPRYARMLQRLFGIKGTVPAKQLAGELMTVLPLFLGREGRILEGWHTYFANIAVVAGGAGTFSTIRITNPSASKIVAVFEKITWLNAASANQTLNLNLNRPSLANLANVTGGSRMDGRGFQNLSSVVVSFGTPVSQFGTAVGGIFIGALGSADLIITDIQEIVLSPGDGYDLAISAANIGISGMVMMWRERPLEDGELVL